MTELSDGVWNGNVYYAKVKKKKRRRYQTTRRTQTRNYAKSAMGSKMSVENESCEAEIPSSRRGRKRVTFLIGNGFDINIGLNTRYQDFYKYYIENNEDDMLAKDINKNYTNWSDLELGLGKYTEEVGAEKEEEFWRSEQNLENELVDYLGKELDRIDLNMDERRQKIKTEMAVSLLEFYKEMPEEVKRSIEQILSDDQKQFFFINFNYTDALDQCVKIIRHSNVMQYEGEDDVLHIHGMISGSMVLGVNDESQIANQEFKNKSEYRRLLIKKDINEFCGKGNIKKACDIIDASDIICIYGMSLGATDKMWWQYIGKWLQGSDNRKLVIFAKGNTEYKVKKFSSNYGEKIKERFRNNGELADVWDQIESKIHVEVNANMFNFKVV